jgi:hypothetical protein
VTIQTAEFDGKGRRMKKTISNSGDLAGTTVYFYEGQKICETRDGSGNMVAQFIHGTQYIDELVMMRSAGKGDLYIHQDANFNVIGVTDLGGSLVERYVLEPYGQLTVHQRSSFGDRDGDGDVDATDKDTPGTTCIGTPTAACRILDGDGDYDATDATLFDNLDPGNAAHPGRRSAAAKRKDRSKRTDLPVACPARLTGDDAPAHSFPALLEDLGTLAKNRVRMRDTQEAFYMLTQPTPAQARALDLLEGA